MNQEQTLNIKYSDLTSSVNQAKSLLATSVTIPGKNSTKWFWISVSALLIITIILLVVLL